MTNRLEFRDNTRYMRLHSIYLLGVVASATAMGLWAAPSVSEVTARQRYPWNGLVDVNFTVAGDSGTKYDTSFTVKDVVGGTNLTMRTLYKSDGTAANPSKEVLSPGTYSWVWNAAADCGSGYKASRVRIEMNCGVYEPLYMVIDLSGGTNATSYPISYLDDVPQGGWSDVYKTTKLVMRRIKAGVNPAGGSMTNDMWVGVFEVTVKQWKLVCGTLPSGYSGTSSSAYNKADNAPIVGLDLPAYVYRKTTASIFLDLLKNKTFLSSVDLPMHEQWEYACRAGTSSPLNNGKNCNDDNLKDIAWFLQNGYIGMSHPVGLLAPNAWGLYDMHGNADEQIKDTSTCRGGSYSDVSSSCSVTSHNAYNGGGNMFDGFRAFATE